jgi:hypothetical protein
LERAPVRNKREECPISSTTALALFLGQNRRHASKG